MIGEIAAHCLHHGRKLNRNLEAAAGGGDGLHPARRGKAQVSRTHSLKSEIAAKP